MWYKLLRRIPGHQRLLRRLEPHRFIAERESELCGAFNWATRELMPGFSIGESDTVVDVGCGEGYASLFAARCGAAVHAVDIDANALAAVERHMQGQNPARPFRTLLSDANPLPLSDGVATRVVAQEVLEHVEDPRQFLGELVRIGRPGTLYFLSVPDPASESLQKNLAPSSYWQKPNHLRVFAHDELDRLVRDAGLEIQNRISYGFFWTMWWMLFWSGDPNCAIASPDTPVLTHWHKTWTALLQTPNGLRVKQALDDGMPKSQIILARRAA